MKLFIVCFFIVMGSATVYAHPMPGSIVELSVLEGSISGEAKIPMVELGNAVGDDRIAHLDDIFFKQYFRDHIKAGSSGKNWSTLIENIRVVTGNDPIIGSYQEVIVDFNLTPPDTRYLRDFTFYYDVVMHQVVTHSALVSVQADWANGIQDENDAKQIGIIRMDIPSGKILPLEVHLEQAGWWKGFTGMVQLGMQHIKEGTDHLLFLMVLLLPAMLKTDGKRWGSFGGTRYSILNLLRIVTAFTIGHSLTLIVGAMGWIKLPGQPIEVLIAVSILVSAIHAFHPLFPGKETFIAAGFGLIHGLAFAGVLANLQLGMSRLALSILGFNLGIEMMQLFIITITIPWLILLSRTPVYKWMRMSGAVLAGIAALAWILERTTGKSNTITGFVTAATKYAPWCIIALGVASVVIYFVTGRVRRNTLARN